MFPSLALATILAAPVPKEADKKGVQLSIALVDASVMAGDLASIQIKLSNHTTRELPVERCVGTTDVMPVSFEIQGPTAEQFELANSTIANDLAFRRAQGVFDSRPGFKLLSNRTFICYDTLFTTKKQGDFIPVFRSVGKYRVRATMKVEADKLTSNTIEIDVKEERPEFVGIALKSRSVIADVATVFQWSDESDSSLPAIRAKEKDFAKSNIQRLIERATFLDDVTAAKTTDERRKRIDAFLKANKERPGIEMAQIRVRLLYRLIKAKDAELAAEMAKQVDDSILGVAELKKAAADLQSKKR